MIKAKEFFLHKKIEIHKDRINCLQWQRLQLCDLRRRHLMSLKWELTFIRHKKFETVRFPQNCQRNEYCQNDKCSIISPHSVKNSNMTRRLRGFRNKTHALSSISQVDLYSFPGAFSHFIYSSTFVFWNLSNKFFFTERNHCYCAIHSNNITQYNTNLIWN